MPALIAYTLPYKQQKSMFFYHEADMMTKMALKEKHPTRLPAGPNPARTRKHKPEPESISPNSKSDLNPKPGPQKNES